MAEIKLVPRSEVDPSITWDMTYFYPSDEAFYAELDKFKERNESFQRKIRKPIRRFRSIG